ncbi:MAG: hypothetical protein WD469_10090 [Paenibacillaceae bacterium]
MKQTKLMNGIMVPTLFALYVYALFKVILFKFDSIEITFLWHQLQKNFGGSSSTSDIIFLHDSMNFCGFL